MLPPLNGPTGLARYWVLVPQGVLPYGKPGYSAPATKYSAQIAGISHRAGEIKNGLAADLVLVNGDPAADISVMYSEPEKVWKNGIIIHMPCSMMISFTWLALLLQRQRQRIWNFKKVREGRVFPFSYLTYCSSRLLKSDTICPYLKLLSQEW